MKKTIRFLFPYLKNKYIMTLLVFLVWVTFFDKNDLITQISQRNKLSQMKDDRAYFIEEIRINNSVMHDLQTDRKALEKFAREKYLMKKADEDVFVVVAPEN